MRRRNKNSRGRWLACCPKLADILFPVRSLPLANVTLTVFSSALLSLQKFVLDGLPRSSKFDDFYVHEMLLLITLPKRRDMTFPGLVFLLGPGFSTAFASSAGRQTILMLDSAPPRSPPFVFC